MNLNKFGMSQPVRRLEDRSLITGRGRFVSDAIREGTLRMCVLRSPHAHASFRIGDLGVARGMKGVHLVLTGADISALGQLPCHAITKNRDGTPIGLALRPILPRGRVHHVGQGIAIVVAENEWLAKDAIEAVPIDWEKLDAITTTKESLDANAPILHPHLPSNRVYEIFIGDQERTDAAFSAAAKTVRVDLINQRVIANYLETRGAIGEWDEAAGHFTLTAGSQGVHAIRRDLCDAVFKIPHDRMRVVSGDVGGGFGSKISAYPEYALVLECARRLRTPVAWIGDRSEHFVGDSQGRDHVSVAEVALDKNHFFLALRMDTTANVGAYAAHYGPATPAFASRILSGSYRFPTVAITIRTAYTNTVPVDAYRGAGRPEATYLIERLVDAAANAVGISASELRTRNFITPAEMPYRTPTGCTYDSGEFESHLRRANEVVAAAEFKQRRKLSKRAGKLRGLGFASYIEFCALGAEEAQVAIEKDGTITVRVGTQANGQGHVTAFSQIVSSRFDIPLDRIRILQGDTSLVANGAGTSGSRSIALGGASVFQAATKLADQLTDVASKVLEAAASDLEFRGGRILVAGTDRGVELAALATSPELSDDCRRARGDFAQPEPTYPNGTHACEVEVDPETGKVTVEGYWVVDDFGNVINPMLLEGQIHGGIAQGIGQALYEGAVYDKSGQLLTASFMDYAMPRASDLPAIHFETRNVPCKTNVLGAKGAGEAGTIGACPAVMNAILDALRSVQFTGRLDMPATPERVWRACQSVRHIASGSAHDRPPTAGHF